MSDEELFLEKEEPTEEENSAEVTDEKKEETEKSTNANDKFSEKQWYVVNTYSGREKIVANYLELRKETMHMENLIFRIVVAEKEEIVLDKKTNRPATNKKGEVKKKIVNLYPGYIFVEAIMSDDAWYVIRNTQGVTGLVGSSGAGTKPFPIPREDMMPILKKMNLVEAVSKGEYAIGDKVTIIDGAFADEEGEITSIDIANSTAGVTLIFFGRPTNVDVPFASIQKIS